MAVNYKNSYYTFVYPSEQVVTFLSRLSKTHEFTGKKALDFGFGAGRHIKLLKDFGFDAYGIDIEPDAKDTLYQVFGEIVPCENLVIGNIFDNESLFEHETFDLILSYGILYIFGYNDLTVALKKLNEMLKPGAHLISSFRTKFDHVYNNPENRIDNYIAVDSLGRKFTYLNNNDLKEIFEATGFKINMTERYDRYPDGKLLSYWLVDAIKA